MKSNYLSFGTTLILLTVQPAAADVTIEQTLDVTAPGALSLAAMEGKTRTAIAGDKSRTDNDLKFKSGLMQRFGGEAGQSTEIVRLDEGLIYHVNHKEREYQATTFDAMKAQTEQAVEQLEQSNEQSTEGADADAAPGQTDLPVSEDQCEWSETVVDVERSGERRQIAGIEAEQTRVTATQTCRDRETGKACDLTWTMENWLAPDVPGSAETAEFWQAYASKLGLQDVVGNPGTPGMAALFSQYEAGWDEIEANAGELEGYPLRSVMALDIGGEECTTSTGEPLSADAVFGDAMQDAAAQGVGESLGGTVGGAVAKGLLGAFGKKKEQPEPANAAATGTVTLFKVVTETTSIDTQSVPDAQFAVPEGYTEVNAAP